MNFAMIGGAIVDGAKKIPAIVWWLVIGIVFFKWVELSSISRGKKEKAAEVELETERELGRVSETRREITQENTDASIRADEAVANLPRVTSTGKLREHSKAVSDELLGPSPRVDG